MNFFNVIRNFLPNNVSSISRVIKMGQTHYRYKLFLPHYEYRSFFLPSSMYSMVLNDGKAEITIPLRLKERLDRKKIEENSKYLKKQQQLMKSRGGRKSETIIYAKKTSLNHYTGQTYSRREKLPLVSQGWVHKKSKGDFFCIKPRRLIPQNKTDVEAEGRTFEDMELHPDIIQCLKTDNIVTPTEIQILAINPLMKNKNALIAAETGCGKTLAYLLPILHRILENSEQRGVRRRAIANAPRAVIVAPSRELVDQIFKVADHYGKKLGIKVKVLQGGSVGGKVSNPSNEQIDILVSSAHILSILTDIGVYKLSRVETIVLDEADSLLDDSFSPTVVPFLRRFSFDQREEGSSNLHLVSATKPRSIDTILEDIISPTSLWSITTRGLHRIMPNVEQLFLRLRKMDKPEKIIELVKKDLQTSSPVMIFCNKSDTCKWMAIHLTANKIKCCLVTGKIPLGERRGLINSFLTGEVDVMVCTDLASRGIDSVRTKHVINYDFPKFLADYVHRCGRVGRVGSPPNCHVTNLISSGHEIALVNDIETSVRLDIPLERVNANIKRILNHRHNKGETVENYYDDEEDDEGIYVEK